MRAAGEGRSDRKNPSAGLWPLLAVIALAQAAWFVWILAQPLPNAANVGGVVRRADLLWRLFPAVIPGLPWSESHLGMAAKHLSHVENLPQRLPILAAALWIALAAMAMGGMILRWVERGEAWFGRVERLALSYVLGVGVLGVLTLLAGRLGWLSPWTARAGLAGVIVLSGAIRARTAPISVAATLWKPAGAWPWATLAVVGPFVILMALGAMLPTIDFDSLEYHLQGPKEFYLEGQIRFLPHNVYTTMPFSIEMLHLLGMHVQRDWFLGALTGQLLVMLFAPAAAVLVGASAARLASPKAAWLAVLVYLTTPWVYRLAAIPYVEGPLCAYHAALLAAAWPFLKRCREKQGRPKGSDPVSAAKRGSDPFVLVILRLSLLLGMLAGGAMACKYPALISAVLPFGALVAYEAIRGRSWKTAAAYAVGVGVVIGPWLIKNVVDTGNPVYPLGYSVFGGRDWDAAREAKWVHAHGPRAVSAATLGAGVLEIAGRSDWQSPLYMALVPLALLRPRSRRAAAWLLLLVLYLFATWYLMTHRLDRFWLPILPILAILAGMGADWCVSRGWMILRAVLLLCGILSNLADITTSLAGLNQWTDDLSVLREEIPRLLNAPLVAMDATLPKSARPLLVGQASVFYLGRDFVYNTVFDRERLEVLLAGVPASEAGAVLREHGITHVYVDWSEIARHRKPGGYGFTDFVSRERLAEWVASGSLRPPELLGAQQELYEVRGNEASGGRNARD